MPGAGFYRKLPRLASSFLRSSVDLLSKLPASSCYGLKSKLLWLSAAPARAPKFVASWVGVPVRKNAWLDCFERGGRAPVAAAKSLLLPPRRDGTSLILSAESGNILMMGLVLRSESRSFDDELRPLPSTSSFLSSSGLVSRTAWSSPWPCLLPKAPGLSASASEPCLKGLRASEPRLSAGPPLGLGHWRLELSRVRARFSFGSSWLSWSINL